MFFEVTFSDGSTTIMQAHSKQQLIAALQNITFTKATQKQTCKNCRKHLATVEKTLCDVCYAEITAACRATWKDITLSDQEVKEIILSYFVNGQRKVYWKKLWMTNLYRCVAKLVQICWRLSISTTFPNSRKRRCINERTVQYDRRSFLKQLKA